MGFILIHHYDVLMKSAQHDITKSVKMYRENLFLGD